MHPRIWAVLLTTVAVGLAGCAADNNSKGRFKVGSSYSVNGKTYYPEENYTREQVGMASWYGPGFQGKKTANGERFDQTALTAAHPTLQMPSLVRVTNLQNNESVVVRVNDRGPFHGGRIIDLSKGAAEALHFRNMGTTKVKLQVLGPESMALAQAAKRGIDTRGAEIAMNEHGMLDERFASFYPTYVAAPQPDVMVASNSFVPAAPVDPAVTTSNIGVPQAPVQQNLTVVDASPLPGQQAAVQVRIPAPQAQIYQMAPVVEGQPAHTLGQLTPSQIKAPILRNAMPKKPVFKGISKTGFFVQAGSPMSGAEAQALQAQMADLGPAQVVSEGGLSDSYRVRIGPFESVEKADHILNTLQRQGQQASIVVSQN